MLLAQVEILEQKAARSQEMLANARKILDSQDNAELMGGDCTAEATVFNDAVNLWQAVYSTKVAECDECDAATNIETGAYDYMIAAGEAYTECLAEA